jgi:hypothetical protein
MVLGDEAPSRRNPGDASDCDAQQGEEIPCDSSDGVGSLGPKETVGDCTGDGDKEDTPGEAEPPRGTGDMDMLL